VGQCHGFFEQLIKAVSTSWRLESADCETERLSLSPPASAGDTQRGAPAIKKRPAQDLRPDGVVKVIGEDARVDGLSAARLVCPVESIQPKLLIDAQERLEQPRLKAIGAAVG